MVVVRQKSERVLFLPTGNGIAISVADNQGADPQYKILYNTKEEK